MTSKERVYNIFKGKEVDRLPRYIWLHDECVNKLKDFYKVTKEEVDFKIGNDVLQTWLSINREMARPLKEKEVFVDEFGISWKREVYYNMVINNPLKDLEIEDIEKYPFPDPYDENRYKEFIRLKEKYGNEYFIGADVSGTIFEPAYHLRGMENLMVDMALEDPICDLIFDKLTDFSLKIALKAIDLGADWIWLGDDQGSQNGMLLGPELWRKYFKPRMKYIIDKLREKKNDIIIAYHSCGSISPIIDDLVEVGINLLNPIQESATNMNHLEIRKKYPNLVMGCGVDTQTFMITHSKEDIYEETKKKINDLGSDGYYLYMASHTIQPDISTEKIIEMLRALNKE